MGFLPSLRRRDDSLLQSKLSRTRRSSMPSNAIADFESEPIKSSDRSPPTSTSSARKRKFHQLFSQVPADESFLNYYSCALLAEILLQGHLYVTPNYFCFYSNVFGYVTKIVIPITSVRKISKEKTVKIIPNAVAVTTKEDRHVFTSFLSRDSTFKLMKQVWDNVKNPKTAASDIPIPVEARVLPPQTPLLDECGAKVEQDDSGTSKRETDPWTSGTSIASTDTDGFSASVPSPVVVKTRSESTPGASSRLWGGLPSGTVVAILVALLAALYVSAALMMVRIDRLHAAYLYHPLTSPDRFIENRLSQFLNLNLEQIVKTRENLQILYQQLWLMAKDTEAGPISGGEIVLEDDAS